MADRDNNNKKKKRVIAIYQDHYATGAGGRHGTEIAKGQGGRPGVGAHLSRSQCTCMHKHTDKSHADLEAITEVCVCAHTGAITEEEL